MLDLARLRICFIAGTLGMGGAERQLFYILKVLREKGADVRLLCLTRGEFWEAPIRELGVRVTWVGQREFRFARLARIILTLRRTPLDILQSQHFFTNLYAALAAAALGIRGVGGMRNDCISEVKANGMILGRMSLRAPRVVAANSQTAIRNAIAMGMSAHRLHFLPNIVDTEQFRPSVKRNGAVRLIAVGRLQAEKRIDRFLRVLARLKKQSNHQFKALIVGDGPERQRLERLAIELRLSPDLIEFRGQVVDMSSVYQDGDVLVLTSDREGTPNVVLEAMASCLPVVASHVGGVAEIVRHGETGYAIDPTNERQMADSLDSLIRNPRLRANMGRRAREYVETHHSPQRLCIALRRMYEVALS